MPLLDDRDDVFQIRSAVEGLSIGRANSRLTRNTLIHELATAMGHRERELFRRPPRTKEDVTFEELQELIKAGGARIEHQMSSATAKLAGWYELLAKLSNEVFIVEHKQR